jgi:hypothetical protein
MAWLPLTSIALALRVITTEATQVVCRVRQADGRNGALARSIEEATLLALSVVLSANGA